MIDGSEHGDHVSDWLRQMPNEHDVEPLLRRFESSFGAVLRRAQKTLGEVSLLAILDRVLYVAAERFPVVAALEVEGVEVHCGKMLTQTTTLPYDQAVLAIRFVLVEFLTVLGHLTAEILTPALHAQLASGRTDGDDHRVPCERPGQAQKDDRGVES